MSLATRFLPALSPALSPVDADDTAERSEGRALRMHMTGGIGPRGEHRLPVISTWVLVTALLLQEVLTLLSAPGGPSQGDLLGALGISVGTAALFLRFQYIKVAKGRSEGLAGLAVAISIGAALALVIDHQWALAPMAISVILLSLPARTAIPVVVIMAVAMGVFVGASWNPVAGISLAAGAVGIALVFCSFVRLSLLIRELQLAREELARTRVDEERLRIQRDLHDMLGRTLVAASMRNQVALRTLGKGPEVTRGHLEQMHSIVTDGQTRLRALTSGPVIASLGDEVESARSLCERIGIRFVSDTVTIPSGAVERYAGAVVREAVTNLLKHSAARECSVRVEVAEGALITTIENDGCDRDAADAASGTGLAHLRAGATSLGGQLEAEAVERGLFRVTACIPLTGDGERPDTLPDSSMHPTETP